MENSTPSASPIIKRAARTYGRKKSPAPIINAFSPAKSPSPIAAPRRLQTPDSDADDDEDEQLTTTDRFAWKHALKQIDEGSDDEHDTSDAVATNTGFGQPSLLLDIPQASQKDNEEPPSSYNPGESLADNLFATPSPKSASKPPRRAGPSLFLPGASGSESEGPHDHPKTSPLSSTPRSRFGAMVSPTSHSSMTPPEGSSGRKKKLARRSLDDVRRSFSPVEVPSNARGRRSDTLKKSKVKKPTKRDREETAKETARLKYDREVKVTADQTRKWDLASLLGVVGGSAKPKPLSKDSSLTSDPITDFTSSPERSNSFLPNIPEGAPSMGAPGPSRPSMLSKPNAKMTKDSDSDSDDLPMLDFTKMKQMASLKERKLRLIAEQTAKESKSQPDSDDDEDLIIVEAPPAVKQLEETHAKSPKKRVSHAQKRVLNLAHVNYHKPKTTQSTSKRNHIPMTHDDLNRLTLAKANRDAVRVSEQKADAFVKVGGVLKQEAVPDTSSSEAVLKAYAEQALKAREEREARQGASDSEEESSDEEYQPDDDRGSASPSVDAMQLSGDEEQAEGDDDELELRDDSATEAADEDNIPLPRAPRRKAIIDSDEENDENSAPGPSRLRPSRLDDGAREMSMEVEMTPFSEDGTDKENDSVLAFDRSEDKENKAVVRFRALSVSDSMETIGPARLLDSLSPSSQSRQPFQQLSGSPDTPKASSRGDTSLTEIFQAQLREPRKTPELQLSPLFSRKTGDEGFSQFSQEETVGNKLSSSSGLTDLFDLTTQASFPSSSSKREGLGGAFMHNLAKPMRGVPQDTGLDLTQDVLQPAFLAKDDLLRKADDIMEKNQGFVLEAAFAPQDNSPKLYVNEDGFLTQTRPEGDNPEVYEPPTPSEMLSPHSTLLTPTDTRSKDRSPLATISYSNPADSSPGLGRSLNRLRRKRSPSPASPSRRAVLNQQRKRPQNAFDVLGQGAQIAADRKRRKLERNDYVEDEARESDDEGEFWGRKKKKSGDDEDEDMDDEDLDKTVEGLVDDHDMDDDTLAADAVLEKVKEQREQDDVAIEQAAQEIVDGKWRAKRKDGGFMDDDSDDDQDRDENARARRKLMKRKKRDDIDALEREEATKPFAAVYSTTWAEEDDGEFAHLLHDETQEVLAGLKTGDPDEYDYDDDQEDDMMDESDQGEITAADFREQLRQRAQQPTSDKAGIDVDDLSWMDPDKDDDDDEVEVQITKPKVAAGRKARPTGHLDPCDLDVFESQHSTGRSMGQSERSKLWAKAEGPNRKGTTARTGSSAAVTGHLQAKSGGGSLRKGGQIKDGNKASASASKPPVKPQGSFLKRLEQEKQKKRSG